MLSNIEPVVADCIYLRKRNLEVFRIQQPDTATLLWTSEDAALRHFQRLQAATPQTENRSM